MLKEVPLFPTLEHVEDSSTCPGVFLLVWEPPGWEQDSGSLGALLGWELDLEVLGSSHRTCQVPLSWMDTQAPLPWRLLAAQSWHLALHESPETRGHFCVGGRRNLVP